MLDKIILYSIRHKWLVASGTLLLLIWGIWSATKLPIDAVPDITNNQVQIITRSPALAAQEVEQFVSYPIERSMTNLPDLEEMRSISRFGLSVITLVFDEKVDVYFARQQINERLKEAEENMPEGMGKPELSPISTGLGEIYQYVLHPAPGAENKYSAMDLRTMQDWIVARQLYGTPGVAEINSFGGYLKQYEVAINPHKLRAMQVGINEIFDALTKNNQNTGGAYIDKKPNAYFIRAVGLVSSLADIEQIAVKKNSAGMPIYMRDVADVRIGSAVRYGALTFNGEKEAVGGIVMMLKGENSAQVVKRVKAKITQIQQSLPKDVVLEPFSDRTELVDRAIATVTKNLIEGALIVIFVLILFLGNIRAGLIVASAIPLSMLFALGMMRVFGVSANLMSLGAIDFGLIVDGSLIVVEATLHHLGLRKNTARLTQEEMDQEVYISSSKIRNSAAFGEIIILLVYIPILTLVGIEGKMFRPMAQTVSFAILGALILSLTYIPMMSALFLSKKMATKENWSERWMSRLQARFLPLLKWVVVRKKSFVLGSVTLLGASLFLFSRLGAEFIPQLQEGDYAFHCILPQGSSLSQSVETSMEAARIIKSFPEVRAVVGKTGSAEIPTDPMPPEATDLIITLKPMSEWTTTKDYQALADAMMEKLSVIPGVFFESSQPIQMRFNELMTGVRQDIAIKVFGEDMDTLATIATNLGQVIQSVEGTTAPQIERTEGLPQIVINFNRAQLAINNLTVNEVNQSVSTAFAGMSAGVVYENERKFDLVLRLDTAFRKDIADIEQLTIRNNEGLQIPLAQVATIKLVEGPAQISREDGKRRVVIGFNTKGRDVRAVVTDIESKMSQLSIFPAGYSYTIGGTFENLEAASNRLLIAVPASLLLIFVLLYLTFRSMKETFLIYSAIPMSAIGGIAALWLRDMPFSISAGVGFIALFGVAVLNGIVLISTYNQLEKEGVTAILTRVYQGTILRLRPVLMTATVASFGFLPMALSTGAGAEVQKPLATVVIGGLISATLLTLFILPCLYLLFFNKSLKTGKIPQVGALILASLACTIAPLKAQEKGSAEAITVGMEGLVKQTITLDEALDIALNQNLIVDKYSLDLQRAGLEVKTSNSVGKTGIFVENEDFTPQDRQGVWKVGLSQDLTWPGFYKARKRYLQQALGISSLKKEEFQAVLIRDVKYAYNELSYLQGKKRLFKELSETYTTLYKAADLRVRTGEAAGLERIAADTKRREYSSLLQQIDQDLYIAARNMGVLLNKDQVFFVVQEAQGAKYSNVPAYAEEMLSMHPTLRSQEVAINLASENVNMEKAAAKPDFSTRVFSQKLWGQKNPYTGFSLTASLPIFSRNYYKNRVKVAEKEVEIQAKDYAIQVQDWQRQLDNVRAELTKNKQQLAFYEESGLQLGQEILKAANLSYRAGEISYAELSQFMTQSIDMEVNYLLARYQYQQSLIAYEFITQSK